MGSILVKGGNSSPLLCHLDTDFPTERRRFYPGSPVYSLFPLTLLAKGHSPVHSKFQIFSITKRIKVLILLALTLNAIKCIVLKAKRLIIILRAMDHELSLAAAGNSASPDVILCG